MTKETLSILEKKRNLMIEKGMKEGFQSNRVLSLSKELDELIYEVMLRSTVDSERRNERVEK